MGMTHTPGPWKFTHDHKDNIFEIETVDQSDGAYQHLTNRLPMSAWKKELRVPCGCSGQMVTNARLMAAAPEMYNLLQAFLDGQWQPMNEARALLARIEGA